MGVTSSGENDSFGSSVPRRRRRRVLAVVTDIDMLSLVRLTLERAGYEVETTTSVAAADRLLLLLHRPGPVDLVIAAASLLDGDGVALALRLGRRLDCPTLTLCAGEFDGHRSSRAGVDAQVRADADEVEVALARVITALVGPGDTR